MTLSVTSSIPSIFYTDELKREFPAIFVYAIAGAGKTNLFRELVDWNPLVLATEDGNTKGMSTLGDLHMACMLLNTLDQLTVVTTELAAKAKPGELYYNGQGPFRCLGVDSLTGVGYFLEEASKKMKGWDMIWDVTKGGGKDPRQAYPYIAEKGRQVVRKLMSLPVPLILTCREQLFTEGEGPAAVTYPVPELPGQKLPRELPGWPEATLRLRMINGERLMVTENEGNIVARVRLPGGQRCPRLIKPNLGALLKVLAGDMSAMRDLERDVPMTAAQQRAQQAVK